MLGNGARLSGTDWAGLRSTEQAKEKVQRNWGSSVPSEAVVYTIKTIYLFSSDSLSSPLALEKRGRLRRENVRNS